MSAVGLVGLAPKRKLNGTELGSKSGLAGAPSERENYIQAMHVNWV